MNNSFDEPIRQAKELAAGLGLTIDFDSYGKFVASRGGKPISPRLFPSAMWGFVRGYEAAKAEE